MTADELLAMTPEQRAALEQVRVENATGNTDCTGCTGCTRCTDCIGIIGGRGLRYVAWGVQLTAEQWERVKP